MHIKDATKLQHTQSDLKCANKHEPATTSHVICTESGNGSVLLRPSALQRGAQLVLSAH